MGAFDSAVCDFHVEVLDAGVFVEGFVRIEGTVDFDNDARLFVVWPFFVNGSSGEGWEIVADWEI